MIDTFYGAFIDEDGDKFRVEEWDYRVTDIRINKDEYLSLYTKDIPTLIVMLDRCYDHWKKRRIE